MIDALKIYDILKAGELPEGHIRAMIAAIQKAESEIVMDVQAILDRQMSNLVTKAALKADLAALKAELEAAMAQLEAKLIRWMFVFWVSQLGFVVGAIKLMR